MTTRQSPPNRRTGITVRIEIGDVVVHATCNFDTHTGQPCELFLAGPKAGSPLAVLLEDAAVLVSVALQHGVPPAALAKSMASVPAGRLTPNDLTDPKVQVPTAPATVLGAVLIWLARMADDTDAAVPGA